MEEQAEQTASGSSVAQQLCLCEECKANKWKYKCPGCLLRSCSLPCVNAHKRRTGCSGKRNQTQYVPISQFDDNVLLSDYKLLEEVKRVAESSQRLRARLCRFSHFQLPFYLRSLRHAAASRRTKLLFLPGGMSKHEKNKSRYDQRKKFISWTIEWRFYSTDIIILDHGVHEDTSPLSVIKNHLEPGPWKNQLRQFCEVPLDSLKFFIRKFPKGPRSPFRELDVKAPLRQQLANLVILEYPVVHVFLPSHKYDFEVIKDANSITAKPDMESVSNGHHSPHGVTFKEEEIQEDKSDPWAVDLTKDVNSSCHSGGTSTEKAHTDPLDVPLLPEGSVLPLSYNTMQLDDFEDMEFEFDQSLIDAYSDLISQINPDDFLDLEGGGELTNKVEEDSRYLSSSRGASIQDVEIEEGEILE